METETTIFVGLTRNFVSRRISVRGTNSEYNMTIFGHYHSVLKMQCFRMVYRVEYPMSHLNFLRLHTSLYASVYAKG